MSNEREQATVLDQLLAAQEPPYDTTGPGLRRRARTVRTRRRVAAGAACILVAGVAVCGAVVGQQLRTADGPPPAAANDDSFDAEVLAGSIADAVLAEAPAAKGAKGARSAGPEVVALDAQGNPIEGSDRQHATLWTSSLDLSSTDRLELSLVNEAMSAEDAQQACDGELAGGLSVSCQVSTVGDAVVLSQVRAVHRQDGAWPVVLGDRLGSANPGSLWFQRRVTATSPEGSGVMVNEFVKAPDLAAAESAWSIAPDGLVDLATNPDLTFPKAPAGEDGCGWVVPDAAAESGCRS